MTFGSLFAGIGGIDLGLTRAGFACEWQVEIDEYARAVLAKHWPDVPRYRDVRFFLGSKKWRRVREAWAVDLICGGFPCQDISCAGKGVGIDGARSGLWREFARILRLLRPRFVLVENTPALTHRGLGRVLGDLAALGYDAEWDCIPAAALGAPHLRWRIFILAYSHKERFKFDARQIRKGQSDVDWRSSAYSNAEGQSQLQGGEQDFQRRADNGSQPPVPDAASIFAGQRWRQQFEAYCEETRHLYWPQREPGILGVHDGVPAFVDGVIPDRGKRLGACGNAVVPQLAEWIGRRIIESERTVERGESG